MKVSFNGLYKIAGNPDCSSGNGETMHDLSNFKLNSFIRDTKPYRETCGYSYYNKNTGDYYLAVKDDCESDFEAEVEDYNIDCVKVGSKLVENDCDSSEEINALYKERTNIALLKNINTYKCQSSSKTAGKMDIYC